MKTSMAAWATGIGVGLMVGVMVGRAPTVSADWGWSDSSKLERATVALEAIARDLHDFAEYHRRLHPTPPPPPTPISQTKLDWVNRFPVNLRSTRCYDAGGVIVDGLCVNVKKER